MALVAHQGRARHRPESGDGGFPGFLLLSALWVATGCPWNSNDAAGVGALESGDQFGDSKDSADSAQPEQRAVLRIENASSETIDYFSMEQTETGERLLGLDTIVPGEGSEFEWEEPGTVFGYYQQVDGDCASFSARVAINDVVIVELSTFAGRFDEAGDCIEP